MIVEFETKGRRIRKHVVRRLQVIDDDKTWAIDEESQLRLNRRLVVVAIPATEIDVESISEMQRRIGESGDLFIVRIQCDQRERVECRRQDRWVAGAKIERLELLMDQAVFVRIVAADQPFELVAFMGSKA